MNDDERQAVADLVLAHVGGDHHEDGTSVDEDDGDHVVQRADVVLFSVKAVVAVTVDDHNTPRYRHSWKSVDASLISIVPVFIAYFIPSH